ALRERLSARRNALALAALGAVGIQAECANSASAAGLIYDLRFADGSHTRTALAGNAYSLELWVQISGTDGTSTDDSLLNSSLAIASTQSNGGWIHGGGLYAGVLASPFNDGAAARAGAGNDFNADGVVD